MRAYIHVHVYVLNHLQYTYTCNMNALKCRYSYCNITYLWSAYTNTCTVWNVGFHYLELNLGTHQPADIRSSVWASGADRAWGTLMGQRHLNRAGLIPIQPMQHISNTTPLLPHLHTSPTTPPHFSYHISTPLLPHLHTSCFPPHVLHTLHLTIMSHPNYAIIFVLHSVPHLSSLRDHLFIKFI